MAIEQRTNRDGSESFRARVKDPAGKFYRSEWKRNRDEAMGEEADQLSRKRKGENAQISLEGGRYTYDEFWEVYAVEDRTGVSHGWQMSQDQMHRDYVSPVLGSRRLAEIRMPDVGRVFKRMETLGLGPQTRKHVYTLMGQVFERARGYYKMIPESPVKAEYHAVKVPKAKPKFLTPAQSWALIDAAKADDCRAAVIELMAGLRLEAVVALTWPNVQWDADQILICQAWKHKVRRIEPFPKGRDAEYVPMTPLLKDYLWEVYGRTEDKDGFVCVGPYHRLHKTRPKMLLPESYGRWLKILCRKAGVPEVSSHALRHSCTELFYEAGASQEDLGRLLNHKDDKTTKRYIHRSHDRLRSIAARISRPGLQVIPGGGQSVTHGVTHVGNGERLSPERGASK